MNCIIIKKQVNLLEFLCALPLFWCNNLLHFQNVTFLHFYGIHKKKHFHRKTGQLPPSRLNRNSDKHIPHTFLCALCIYVKKPALRTHNLHHAMMTYKKVLIYQTTLKTASKIRSIFSILSNSYFVLLSFLEVFVNVWKLYQSDDTQFYYSQFLLSSFHYFGQKNKPGWGQK